MAAIQSPRPSGPPAPQTTTTTTTEPPTAHHPPAYSYYEPQRRTPQPQPPIPAATTDHARDPDAESILPPYHGPGRDRSDAAYLAALREWAEGKLYMEPARDGGGRAVGLTGFYGALSGEDYVRREAARRMSAGGAGPAFVVEAGGRESGRPAGGRESRSGSGRPAGEGRRRSFAEWVRRRRSGDGRAAVEGGVEG